MQSSKKHRRARYADRQMARQLTTNIIDMHGWKKGTSWFRRWRSRRQIYRAVLHDCTVIQDSLWTANDYDFLRPFWKQPG